MPTTNRGYPYESGADQPGHSLTGGSDGDAPILAQVVDADVQDIDNRLSTGEGDIGALEGRMTTAESGITSLDSRVTTAENDITSLEGRVTTSEGDIGALDTRVTTNEGDIAANTAELDTAIKRGDAITQAAWDDVLFTVDQADDSATEPDTSLWPNRLEFRFDGGLVQWFNEFFEWRGAPSSPLNDGTGPSRVGWRLFAARNDTAWAARDTTPVWEIQNYRSGASPNETLAAVDKNGDMTLAGALTTATPAAVDLVLEADVSADDPAFPPRARLLPGGLVVLAGVIDPDISFSAGQVLATVPAGFRPETTVRLSGRTGTLPNLSSGNTVQIDTAGAVTVPESGVGAGGGVGLDGFTYIAAPV